MVSLSSDFNIVCFSKTPQQDAAIFRQSGLPGTAFFKWAFVQGLQIERLRLKNLQASQAYEICTLGPDGSMRYETVNPQGNAAEGAKPLSAAQINALRHPAETEYSARVVTGLSAQSNIDEMDDEAILKDPPSTHPVVGLALYKEWRRARDLHIERMKTPMARAKPPLSYEQKMKLFEMHVEAETENLAREKMDKKLARVRNMLACGEELFDDADMFREAIYQTLTQPLERKNMFDVEHIQDETRRLLFLHDLFTIDLGQKSSVAALSRKERAFALALCRRHMNLRDVPENSFPWHVGKAAGNAYILMLDDLFCPADIKESHGLKVTLA